MGYHLRAGAAAGPRVEGRATRHARTPRARVGSGYRYYSPELGRWINRDPIGEEGGIGLYAITANVVPNEIDYLGLYCVYLYRYTNTELVRGPYNCTPWMRVVSGPPADFFGQLPGFFIGIAYDVRMQWCTYEYSRFRTSVYLCCDWEEGVYFENRRIEIGPRWTRRRPRVRFLDPPRMA